MDAPSTFVRPLALVAVLASASSAGAVGPHQAATTPIRIRVVDRDGRPLANVPVAIDERDPQTHCGNCAEPREIWSGVTAGTDGEAIVRDATRLMDKHTVLSGVARNQLLQAYVDLPALRAKAIPLDPRRIANEPIVLTLDHAIELEVELLDPDGSPVVTNVAWRVAPIAELSRATSGGLSRWWFPEITGREPERTLSTGRFRLCFQAGVAGVLEVATLDGRLIGARGLDADLLKSGSTSLTIRLAPAHRRPDLNVRVVDLNGDPVAERDFIDEADEPRSGFAPPDLRHSIHHSDRLGRLSFPLPGVSNGHLLCPQILRLVRKDDPWDDGEPLRGRIGIEIPVADTSDVDAGDVVLEPAPLLVAGRVVTEEGRPIPRAEVHVTTDYAFDDLFRTRTDVEGRFAIYRPTAVSPDQKDARLAVDAPGFVGPGAYWDRADRSWTEERSLRAFKQGDAELEIRLKQEARVVGELALDADLPASWVSLHVSAPGFLRRLEGNRFEIVGPRGKYSLEARILGWSSAGARHDADLIAEVDDLELDPDRTEVEARLAPLDLRGAVVRMEIEVVDPTGSPLEYAPLAFQGIRFTEGPEGPRGMGVTLHADAFGREVILARPGTAQVAAGSAGLRSPWIDVVPGRKRLTIARFP